MTAGARADLALDRLVDIRADASVVS